MPIPGFTIDSIRTSTQVDGKGSLVDYLEVYFTTSDGDNSFLRVPKAFSAAEIKKALKDEADKLLALRQ